MVRSTTQRVADAKAMLAAGGSDAWLATAHDGSPHLVPLSLAWNDEQESILFCTEKVSRTATNISEGNNQVRVACGSSRNVVMVDGFAEVLGLAEELPDVNRIFVAQTGWDPSHERDVWVYIQISLDRVQAWTDVAEISGRTVMRNGRWSE